MNTGGSGNVEFERLAAQRRGSIAGEFWALLMRTKKWWLAPVILVLLGICTIVFLGGTAAAPFIYTLF